MDVLFSYGELVHRIVIVTWALLLKLTSSAAADRELALLFVTETGLDSRQTQLRMKLYICSLSITLQYYKDFLGDFYTKFERNSTFHRQKTETID